MAPVYSLALSMYAVTSASRFTSSSVTSFAPVIPAVTSAMALFTPVAVPRSPVPALRPELAKRAWGVPLRRRWCRREGNGFLLFLVPQVTDRAPVGLHAQVGRQLQAKHLAVHVQHHRMQPADGDDPIPLFQLAEHLSTFPLLGLLRPEEQQVDDHVQRHHEEDRADRKPLRRRLQNNHPTPPPPKSASLSYSSTRRRATPITRASRMPPGPLDARNQTDRQQWRRGPPPSTAPGMTDYGRWPGAVPTSRRR